MGVGVSEVKTVHSSHSYSVAMLRVYRSLTLWNMQGGEDKVSEPGVYASRGGSTINDAPLAHCKIILP